MNTPNPAKYKGDADYLRGLVARSQLAQVEMAARIGIDPRTFRRYVTGESRFAYPVQFAVESVLAEIEAAAIPASQLREIPARALEIMAAKATFAMRDNAPTSHAYRRAHKALLRSEREIHRRGNGKGE
jgi:hypothetical protein